ncbi:uncharacterized protein LOC144664674 isoform X3 [Oculina patagonica]
MSQVLLLAILFGIFSFSMITGGDESDFGPWSRWSACSQFCGPGERYRTRSCIRDGDCIGQTLEMSTCYRSKCYISCRQYFEDGYERDGIYRLFVDGPCKRPVKTLCDQSRKFGGGWTLLVQAVTSKGWNDRTVLQRNAYTTANKLSRADFSILGKADVIKHDPTNNSPFLYRLDANQPGRWGGVWQAPNHYTFTEKFANLTGVTMLKRFDKWTSGPFAISDRMPWLPKSQGLALLTTNDRSTEQIPWGTIVARHKWPYDPSPWIYNEMIFPGRIWYWLKEGEKDYKEPDIVCPVETPLPVDGRYSAWSAWSVCSQTCSTGYKVRARYCNSPRPANGGKDCSELGPSRETLVCKPWPPCNGSPKHSPLRSPNGLCLIPRTHSCAVNESDVLVFDTDCISDSTWFLLRDDGSLQHACSEMCVKPLSNGSVPTEGTPVGLSFHACDDQLHRFQKTQGVAHGKAIQYRTGKLCLQSVSGNTPAKGDVVVLGKKCEEGWDAFKRVFTFPSPDCSYGMQTGLRSDSRLSSSSVLSGNFVAPYGRLRNRTSAWCANGGDTNPFFQVDLGYADEIKGVATQGQEANYWLVRKFTLSFSLDGATWFNYTANGLGTTVFNGTSHPLLVKPSVIDPSVTARFVRINPIQWYQKPCLRMELYRCSLRNADSYEL